MRSHSPLAVITALVLLVPSLAQATSCSDWNGMSENGKWNRIDRMINDAIEGQDGRSYGVNRNAIRRCLLNHSEDIFWDFEDLCADSRTASMSAIRRRFKDYIWTCVN
jgi:hypothetical protein